MKKFVSLFTAGAVLLSLISCYAVHSFAEVSGTIALDTPVAVNCTKIGNWDVRTFIPNEDGIYIFSSSGNYDTLGYIALAENEASNENMFDDGGQSGNFACTYNMKKGVEYYLGSTIISGETGIYTVSLVKFEANSGIITPFTQDQVEQRTPVTTSICLDNETEFYTYTPDISGTYVFRCVSEYDTDGYLFDQYWRQIGYDMDSGDGANFEITADLNAGEIYYFGYSTTSKDKISINLFMYRTRAISSVETFAAPSKTDYIQNVECKPVGEDLYQVDLNMLGFKFRVNYSNGEYELFSYTMYSKIRGFSCETSYQLAQGTHTVPYSYMGITSSFDINVIDNPVDSVSVIQLPENINYYDEDGFTVNTGTEEITLFNVSVKNMILKVNYTNGTSENIKIEDDYGVSVNYFDYKNSEHALSLTHGENIITVLYMEHEVSFSVYLKYNADNWDYELSADGTYAVVTAYNGEDTEAIIPEMLGGVPVTEIGEQCFYGSTGLQSVRMTDSITSIASKAFYGCDNLTEITIPQNVTSIGTMAFYGLKKVEHLYWNATEIDSVSDTDNIFAYLGSETENGTRVEFGGTCAVIPSSCFYMNATYTPNITEIMIGENVKTIGNNAFRNISALKKVEWNALNVNDLAANANLWYGSGTDEQPFCVVFEASVINIPECAFFAASAARAPKVESVYIYGKETTIGNNAFKNCPGTFYCYYGTPADEALDQSLYTVEYLDPKLESLTVASKPSKLNYTAGDELDLSGIVAVAVFTDGSMADVSDQIVPDSSSFDMMTPGVYLLRVDYTYIGVTKSAEFEITVGDPRITGIVISSLPDKLVYTVGDVPDISGIAVNAVYSNGTYKDITSDISVSDVDMSFAGEKTITVSCVIDNVLYSDKYTITVEEKTFHPCDVDCNGIVDVADISVILIIDNYGYSASAADNARSDTTGDGLIDAADLSKVMLADYYGKTF